MSNMTELTCQYDSRKSFYGKAHVYSENGRVILRSYSTDVAYIEGGRMFVNGRYSATTDRHVREFMKQYGFMHLAQSPWAEVMEICDPAAKSEQDVMGHLPSREPEPEPTLTLF